MQQINTEQQQANVRLPRQLPANIIKETTLPIRRKHLDKNSQSALNHSEKLTGENQQQWPSRRLQTDLADFDTHRSLSSCPTYSSLSRHSPETRECATQITTITPIHTIEDDQEILNDSPLPIDNNQVLLVDEIPFEEVELMPVSSGFGYYPHNYPTTKTDRVLQPQIVSRALQNNQRDNNQHGFNGNSKTKSNGKPRPTAVIGSPRSDANALPAKQNEINSKVPKNNSLPNGFRRAPPKEPAVRNSSPLREKKQSETMHKNGATRPPQKYLSSPSLDQEDFGRKPVRFVSKHNAAYYPSSPPAYYQKPAPLSQDDSGRPRRMRVANNEYVVQRRRQQPPPPPPPPPEYIYDDYPPDSPIQRRRPQRAVRVLRDASYREDDYANDNDVYYVEHAPTRRAPVVRRAPATEYVYVNEAPAPIRRRPRRPEVVYVDEDPPVEYEDEYIYVDEDGNEVDVNERSQTPSKYVEYVYEDEKDKRRSHKPKVVYVDDDAAIDHEQHIRKSKQPSSTRIVYE